MPGRPFRLVWCDSALQIRAALAEAPDGEGLVVLTSLAEDALGGDVVARLARARLHTIANRPIACELFHARSLDARLAGRSWMADVLIEQAPPQGYRLSRAACSTPTRLGAMC